ncbi:capping protein inhibiting regulator of actin dynamics [Trichomycterus rosablanca]|uniref:capping protein inhibiting regulator of actin dynamics n=1 Tax=Trichomycterus rosablanca TaxID=2290929 RepID=UPI002F35ECC7
MRNDRALRDATESTRTAIKHNQPDRRRLGKFQPFRRLFGKKRRRETDRGFEETKLKLSHSTGDVCNGAVSGQESNQHLRETNPLGSRAFSHESIFIPEDSIEKPCSEQTMSQDNVSDKVKNLQRQIAHNIKFGQKPPSVRKSEGDEGSSDEEEVPRSPLRVLAQVEPEPQDTETREKVSFATHDVAQHRTPVKSPRTKRPPPPGTIESINLDAVPQSAPRLDNTAAKHKLSVKPKNQRISRKHRRFTQDFHEVDISAVLYEETEPQTLAEDSGVRKEEYIRSHRTSLEQEPSERSKKQKLQEKEQKCLELQRKWEQDEQRRREIEKQRRKEEELRLEEEHRKCREQEERLRREEEDKRWQVEERRKEEEEQKKREEEQRLREEEERKRREEDKKKKIEEERRKAEEERRKQQELLAERLRLEEEKRKREAEEEERKKKEAEERQRLLLEEKRRREELELQEELKRQQEEEAKRKRLAEERERKRQQEEASVVEELTRTTDPEWKRKAEELRWKEMEERQRPFTFKVSSGEKQILFQKVNLSPVTPVPGQQGDTGAEIKEGTSGVADSPVLSSSLYVPHTAILVTGAQLCGTAVNLDQIKDTACKSLLGLSEDKKALAPQVKSKTLPDRKSGRTKSLNESSLSADQSNADVLAEWANIRSKIFKGAEDGMYQEYPDQTRKQGESPTSEDVSQPPFSHTNVRKTVSASAKFSITPASKKFADSNRNSEVFSPEESECGKVESPSTDAPNQPVLSPSANKSPNKAGKTVRISESNEECKFAKDLPSFLVPNLPHGSPKSPISPTGLFSQVKSEDSETKDYEDQKDQSGDERPPPFGIKLRRTNYSLRFHSEQSTEKRKKRYSAGDSFEGIPVPLTSDHNADTSVFSQKTSSTTSSEEISKPCKLQTICIVESRSKPGRNTLPSVGTEHDKAKPPLYQKPTTFPKPSEVATPTPSSRTKPGRKMSGEALSPRSKGPELKTAEEYSYPTDDIKESVQSQRNSQGDEEPKEKKSFFPSISIPWREKTDRRTELIRKEKPSLQSRHSLDSSRAQEKEAGPLWITLALQKQKGFREQQQTREERRIQREAKLAEKQARERESVGVISLTDSKGNGNTSPPKPQTPEENKRPDTLLTRFEKRDNLKKANTLPSSVTVEISDATPSPPAAKDIKRFPPTDTTQVSTEPAWLALAKRKAKAWSDCPQIIK